MLRFAGSFVLGVALSACGSSQQASSPAPEPIANRAPDAGPIADAAPPDAAVDSPQMAMAGLYGVSSVDGGVAHILGNAPYDGGPFGLVGSTKANTGWGTVGSSPGGSVVVGTPASAQSSLNKDEIQRSVRRNLSRIRYCYEKQLLRDPALEGRIKVSFVIGADGKVGTASLTEGLHAEVDRCVLTVVRSLQFPRPRGGGTVTVNYPFLFETAADAPADAGPAGP